MQRPTVVLLTGNHVDGSASTSDSQREPTKPEESARKLSNEIMSSIIDAIDRRREDLLRKKPKLN